MSMQPACHAIVAGNNNRSLQKIETAFDRSKESSRLAEGPDLIPHKPGQGCIPRKGAFEMGKHAL